MISNKFERKSQIVHMSNGSEFISYDTQTFLAEEGILHGKSVSFILEQKDTAERKLRSLLEMSKSMLMDAGLPNKW